MATTYEWHWTQTRWLKVVERIFIVLLFHKAVGNRAKLGMEHNWKTVGVILNKSR